jgi:hypothetical protein
VRKENVSRQDMPEVVTNWLFDPSRKPGDTAMLYNESSGYHLVYFEARANCTAMFWPKGQARQGSQGLEEKPPGCRAGDDLAYEADGVSLLRVRYKRLGALDDDGVFAYDRPVN